MKMREIIVSNSCGKNSELFKSELGTVLNDLIRDVTQLVTESNLNSIHVGVASITTDGTLVYNASTVTRNDKNNIYQYFRAGFTIKNSPMIDSFRLYGKIEHHLAVYIEDFSHGGNYDIYVDRGFGKPVAFTALPKPINCGTKEEEESFNDRNITLRKFLEMDPSSPKEKPEIIICAAARDPKTMIVYPSVRHSDDIFWRIMDDKYSGNTEVDCGHFEQGFLTNKSRFVDRSEAWEIAEREGQIRFELPCDYKRQLYSENLY